MSLALLAACPLRARSLEFGHGALVHGISGHLVPMHSAVLVDQRGPGRAVAHALHQLPQAYALFTG